MLAKLPQESVVVRLEVVHDGKVVLTVRQFALHLSVCVVDDGKEHVLCKRDVSICISSDGREEATRVRKQGTHHEDEEDEEDVGKEEDGTQDAVRGFQVIEVEVPENQSEEREAVA